MPDATQPAATPSSSNWMVIVFWGVIVAGIALWYFWEDRAEVLLNVSTQPELVSGMVTFAGAPARGGVMHVVVSEARNKHYLAGTTLPVGDDGKFTSHGHPGLGIAENSRPLFLSAMFRGTLVENEKENPKVKALYGESALHLNSSPPLGERFLLGVAVAGLVLLGFQLVLFTGDLGQRKARWLFMLMYFFTFFSLALPIVVSLVVSQNQYLIDSMEASPIGLVKAKTRALSEPQWLVNIGGMVVHDRKPNNEAGKTTETTVGSEASSVPLAAATADSGQVTKLVESGVAVPFYVLLLAMFGAGINMTLKVPEIQRSYEDVLSEARSPAWNPFMATWRLLRGQTEAPAAVPTVVPRKTAGDIRRELIENYMYLLSAPLLAVAMYYLLQVLAEQVTQPLLVIMAFATGLISKAVIGGIIDLAESKLLGGKRPPGVPSEQLSAEVTARVAEAEVRQAEAEAAARVLNEATARQSETEMAAKAAEEAVRKATEQQVAVEAAAGGGGATQAEVDTVKEEAEKAMREAAAKQAEAQEATKALAETAQETEAKQAEARAATNAAQEAKAKQVAAQVESKQAKARAAAEATEEAAKETTEKLAEAEAAVKAAVQPAQEVTSQRPEATTDQTKKD
jgi:hypothetical protein